MTPMLDSIIKFSLRNRLPVLAGAVLLLAGGLYTTYNMDVDVFPDLNAPTVVVKDIPDGCVAVGNPCRVVKFLEKE